MTDLPEGFYALDPKKHGMRGAVPWEPKLREQDKEAHPLEGYAIIFFPKIENIGIAQVGWFRISGTLSQTPEAAVMKFMDTMPRGEKWEDYVNAGHKVRKVKITDLGDP